MPPSWLPGRRESCILPTWPRKLRLQYPGAVCHAMNRDDRREANFAAAPDPRRFLETVERRRTGDPSKVQLAAAVRSGTTVPLAWIAERLASGSRGYLTRLLYRQGQKP